MVFSENSGKSFKHFSIKSYVLGIYLNILVEAFLIYTNKIYGYYGHHMEIILKYEHYLVYCTGLLCPETDAQVIRSSRTMSTYFLFP